MSYENMRKYDEELAKTLISFMQGPSLNASEYILSGAKISGVVVQETQKLSSEVLEYLSQNDLPLVLIPYHGYNWDNHDKYYIDGKEVDKWYNDELVQ